MFNKQHHQMVQEQVKAKFKRSDTLVSKRCPAYPASAERELVRVTNAYMKLMNQEIKEHLPAIMAAYNIEMRKDARFDDFRDVTKKVEEEFRKIFESLEKKFASFRLDRLVEKAAEVLRKNSVREWKRTIRDTLGIDIFDDYYNGDFYEQAVRRWIDENVLKIKSIPQQTLTEMQDIIKDGYTNGRSIRKVSKAIQETYRVSKSKAQSLARDQIGSLNAQITQMQCEDAGCECYKWSDSGDIRVRDCHRALNGHIFRWDDPPEMWYMTKSRGKVMTGRRCHPGQDYCCRCVAIPVFDYNKIDVPMKGKA